MASKKKPKDAPAPPLGEVLRGRFSSVIEGPYDRWIDAKHLGPYSPRWVPIRTLKFMREHPQLSLGLAAYRGPFFGIEYDVAGGTPTTRAFVRKAFLETKLMVRALLTIMNSLDFGFQPHEVIYGFQDLTVDAEGSGEPAQKFDLATVITEINDIDPERVFPIVDDRDRLLGYRLDGWSLNTIPIEKAVHAVHMMEHRNWRGRSLLRRAYKPWWWAEFVALFMTRWYERKSDPPYHGIAPAEPRPDPKSPGQMIYPTQVMRDQLLDVRSSGAIVTPNEIDPVTKQQKWQIRELTDGGRAGEFVTGLTYLDALMLRAINVPEEVATRGSVGSQAKTETVMGVFLQALETVKETVVLSTINTGIIEPLIRWNFGDSEPAPYIVAPDFNHETKALLGQLLVTLAQVPQQLDGDKEVRAVDMLDLNRFMSQLSVPYRKAAEVARAKGSFAPPVPVPAAPKAPENDSTGDGDGAKRDGEAVTG